MNISYRSTIPGAVAVLALIGATAALAAEKSRVSVAFEQLASLVGEWKGVQGDTEVDLIYTRVADGSVLMEEFRPANKPVMITMFSVDGDHILATHYCSAGNQPQMATEAITDTESPKKSLAFSLVRVTGMTTPEDWHNTGLVMILEEKERLTQEWTYQYEGKSGKNVFHFTRTHVGIDVHKNQSQICILTEAGELERCAFERSENGSVQCWVRGREPGY